ncbi:hypothetical protein CAPTEDRAFT_216207 [Capitella teleta]|uniref:F5/8 type C domain-containing protein n=1 Tax=Capitella teleta TaxID=283909 RepID=R7VAW6_CAPTE|nr:hypothetical protein CAPTEDRAFT_216207 [Capitella teleta]|eukprot:ELU13481.1 hypothetical protein CAPTEDRAFT_216207 [Capitella teleta]
MYGNCRHKSVRNRQQAMRTPCHFVLDKSLNLIINVEDGELTSSSEYEFHSPRSVKLTGLSWRPSPTDPDPWIEVDLLTNMPIEGVVTWGATLNDYYVNSYSIEHRSEGSDILLEYTDNNGDNMISSGNDFHLDSTLNELYGGIYGRYVRLHVLGYGGFPKMRWELLGCTKFIHPFVDHLPGPHITSRDSSSTNCINLYFIKIGIGVNSLGSNTGYTLCEIGGSGVGGTCHAVYRNGHAQVGQPFNMLLMVTGGDTAFWLELSFIVAGCLFWVARKHGNTTPRITSYTESDNESENAHIE